MKQWLSNLAERVDAMALRERVLLFVATMACALAVVDTWWLAPAQDEQKLLASNLRREDADLEQLRSQLRLLGASTVGRAADLAEIARMREESQRLGQDISALTADARAVSGLSRVLVQVLRQQEGLTLVRVATLAADPVVKPQSPASAPSAHSMPVVRTHRVELAVSGPYLELARYLRTLEQALPKLNWGRLRLTTENAGASLLVLQVSYLEVMP